MKCFLHITSQTSFGVWLYPTKNQTTFYSFYSESISMHILVHKPLILQCWPSSFPLYIQFMCWKMTEIKSSFIFDYYFGRQRWNIEVIASKICVDFFCCCQLILCKCFIWKEHGQDKQPIRSVLMLNRNKIETILKCFGKSMVKVLWEDGSVDKSPWKRYNSIWAK